MTDGENPEANQAPDTVPDHVPPELVKPWEYIEAPGARDDVHGANTVLFDGPDIFYSPNILVASQFGGWQVTRASLIREILRDAENFTSHNLTGFPQAIGERWDLIPLEIDGEAHARYRGLLNPLFNPAKADGLVEKVRELAISLAEQAKGGRGTDFQSTLGDPFPVGVFLHLMGWPVEDMPTFLGWVHKVLHGATLEDVRDGARSIKGYLLEVAAEPDREGLFNAIRNARIDGRMLEDDEWLGIVFTLFLAGLDTVANTLGFSFRYLAANPAQQNLLRGSPELIPNAMHELIRAFPPATTTRAVTRDLKFHGVQFRKGDIVRLLVQIAGRDSDVVEDPLALDFHRRPSSQLSFGIGQHICLGQHLARLEVRIALEEWLPRLPEFRLDPDIPPVFEPHGVWGVKTLPLLWERAA
ncbi:cytochrome P450 [Novosphingobium malaysiense]|uniref:cytochrome P450 n=1 Tax=Novosphingobium malaysiense TaxID=1348853 RepID=UPI00068E79BB|nr:cytochrome P450 [Novosphingobium malaysiense]